MQRATVESDSGELTVDKMRSIVFFLHVDDLKAGKWKKGPSGVVLSVGSGGFVSIRPHSTSLVLKPTSLKMLLVTSFAKPSGRLYASSVKSKLLKRGI